MSLEPGKQRCKKGTKKYKPLGPDCYSEEEINNFKSLLSEI